MKMSNLPDFSLNIETGKRERDESWMDARRGKFTASRLGELMTQGRSKGDLWGNRAITYIYELINAITSGQDHIVTSKSMEWGHDHEWDAVEAYEKVTGAKVKYGVGFIHYNSFSGGTPDGLVGENGMIEVKCPFNGANHIRSIIDDYIKPEYLLQVQGNLLFTDRQWCDFVSYDPRQNEGLQLYIQRVERNEEIINAIENRLDDAKRKLDELIQKLEASND